jgi:hypothetical protein
MTARCEIGTNSDASGKALDWDTRPGLGEARTRTPGAGIASVPECWSSMLRLPTHKRPLAQRGRPWCAYG